MEPLDPLRFIVYDLYLSTFAATHDAYVLDSGRHVNERLTPELVDWALTNKHSLSGYMAAETGSGGFITHVAAIDLDEGTLEDGLKVREVLATHAIPSLLVESRRGCHLWAFPLGPGAQPVPVGPVTRALNAAAMLSGLEGPKVEVFPKPSSSRWGVGALRMPLMPHPKVDGKVFPAHAPSGEVITDIVDLINCVATMNAPLASFEKLAGKDVRPVEYPRNLGSYAAPTTVDPTTAPTITGLLGSMGLEVKPGHTIKCPFHQDGHASLSVAKDDMRVWCKAPACPAYNGGRGLGSLALRSYMGKTQKETIS